MCVISSFTMLKRRLGIDRGVALCRSSSTFFYISSEMEGIGSRPTRQEPWVPEVTEAVGISPHCPDTGISAERWWLLWVHTWPCPFLPVRAGKRSFSHKGRAAELGDGASPSPQWLPNLAVSRTQFSVA